MLHSGNTATTTYYQAAGHRVALKTSNTLYYLVTDHLGGTALVLKSDASLQATQLYAPYGAVRSTQGTVPTTYNFTGQRLDGETGLLYFHARYYDAQAGVFTAADSAQGNAQGMSPYAYVAGNPETETDPTGQYMATPIPLSQPGGAIGYSVPGSGVITSIINDGGGNVWSLDGQFSRGPNGLSVNTYTIAQEQQYGGYNPNTDPNNSPWAKFARTIGLDQLQQAWNDPHATFWSKLGALGNFALTNLNNAFQLAMILGGGPEGEELAAAEEEGSALLRGAEEGGSNVEKTYSAEGDPALRALRRPAFDDMKTNGVEVNGQTYKLSEHAYRSLFKSGRKDIMPDDIIDALANDPQPADPGSVRYVNPATGTRIFVNVLTNLITGIWPGDFLE